MRHSSHNQTPKLLPTGRQDRILKSYLSINGADHSYKAPETKEPVYKDEGVTVVFEGQSP